MPRKGRVFSADEQGVFVLGLTSVLVLHVAQAAQRPETGFECGHNRQALAGRRDDGFLQDAGGLVHAPRHICNQPIDLLGLGGGEGYRAGGFFGDGVRASDERPLFPAGYINEVMVEDDGSNPDTALQKARKLVEQGRVHMLFGNLLANTGLAVANYVKGTGTPYFIPIIAADDLTQRARIGNVVRVAGYNASQCTRPLADWALKQGYKKIAAESDE